MSYRISAALICALRLPPAAAGCVAAAVILLALPASAHAPPACEEIKGEMAATAKAGEHYEKEVARYGTRIQGGDNSGGTVRLFAANVSAYLAQLQAVLRRSDEYQRCVVGECSGYRDCFTR